MHKQLSLLLVLIACGQPPSGPDSANFMDAGLPDGRFALDASDSGWTEPVDAGLDAAALDSGENDSGPLLDEGPPPVGCGREGWCWVMGAPLRDFHGPEGGAVFAVGVEGTIRVFDGEAWSDHSSPTRARIDSVVAKSAREVWILADHEIWHFDGTRWRLQLVDEGLWRGDYFGHVDHLILDAEGQLFTALRKYSGNYYWSKRHVYADGEWREVEAMRRVDEDRAADSYDASLRRGASAFEHAFDASYFADVPTEVWVNGALAAWGTQPSDVVRVRATGSSEQVWERQTADAFESLEVDAVEPYYSEPRHRRFAVAGFPSGRALAVREGDLFVISGTTVRSTPQREALPRIKALEDGRVAQFFIELRRSGALGRVLLRTSESEARTYTFQTELCPANSWGSRGLARFVDLAVDGEEIWASLMMDSSRTGTPCLLHYDGSTWAARQLADEILMADGYAVTIGAEGALLYSRDTRGFGTPRGPHILEVPRAFMRSDEAIESLVQTAVPQALDFRGANGPRLWQGPTGLWLYENDQALFRASERVR
ncbi:MAG: hypothetical protein ACI9KE_000007 [Polyangiales bacterium]|jgi:hypothetical protein